MKKQLKSFINLVACAMLTVFASCTPDDHDLPAADIASQDLVEGIAFSVEPDAENPNIIHLKSLMPSQYTVAWEHPQGNTTAVTHDLKIPFAGEYEVKFGVNTRGGMVWSEPYKFTLDQMCDEFIQDELWTMIAGGAGKSKTWLLDIDAEGKTYSPFKSPIFYFNTGYTWDMLHNAKGENYFDANPWDPTTAIDTNFPVNSDGAVWYWTADYAGNTWMCTADDYGTFTFDLDGGANITTVNKFEGEKTGKYMIDAENHKLTLSGLSFYPIDSRVANCYSFDIIYASEDFLQLLCTTGDGNTSVCLNFMSQDYRNNWEEPVEVGLPEGWFTIFNYQNLYASYVLSSDDTYDYFDLAKKQRQNKGGSLDELESYTLKFDGSSYVAGYGDGESVEGKFTVSQNGLMTLDKSLGGSQLTDGVPYGVGSDFEILDVTIEDGKIMDMWIGYKQTDFSGKAYQYLAYHYVALFGGAAPAETYKAQVHIFDAEAWTPDIYTSEEQGYLKVEDGKTYSITVNADFSNAGHMGYYVEAEKLTDKHPNCDIIINYVSVDGNKLSIPDQSVFSYDVDNNSAGFTSARRTILNGWAWDGTTDTNPIPTSNFKCSSSIEVNFTVVFESPNAPFVKTEE